MEAGASVAMEQQEQQRGSCSGRANAVCGTLEARVQSAVAEFFFFEVFVHGRRHSSDVVICSGKNVTHNKKTLDGKSCFCAFLFSHVICEWRIRLQKHYHSSGPLCPNSA